MRCGSVNRNQSRGSVEKDELGYEVRRVIWSGSQWFQRWMKECASELFEMRLLTLPSRNVKQ